MAKLKVIGILLLFVISGVLLFHDHLYNLAAITKRRIIGEQPSSTYTPTPVTSMLPSIKASASASLSPSPLPLSPIILDVPFLVQAPFANWDALHEEACEETSLLNVFYFIKGKKAATRDAGETEIQDLVKYETEHGYEVSITLAQLNQIAQDKLGLTTGRIATATVDAIKREMSAGRPVIVGAAGKILPNPFFKNGGPNYHMLVIKGYDDNGVVDPKKCRAITPTSCTGKGVFITNDVGISQGNNFLYTYDSLLNAIHDWDKQDITQGSKNYLVFEEQGVRGQ